MTTAASLPTVDDVGRIAALENPIVRNLEITNCYARLSAAFAARGGPGANWCTYATWASRQAGRTIRGEDLLDEAGRRIHHGRWLLSPVATLGRRLLRRGLLQPETRLGRLAAELHTPFDAVERATASLARSSGSSPGCGTATRPTARRTCAGHLRATSAPGAPRTPARAFSSPSSRTSRSASTSRPGSSRRSSRRSTPPSSRRSGSGSAPSRRSSPHWRARGRSSAARPRPSRARSRRAYSVRRAASRARSSRRPS